MSIYQNFLSRLILFILLIPLLGISVTRSEAAVLDEIVNDFKPVSGYLVRVIDDEYIIYLDSPHRVAINDLFSVLKSEEKLIHPVTQKVIGTLEEVKGILKVTRLKSGYSYARALGKAIDLKKGDPIRRYENLNTIFWDYTGQGRPFFVRLQSALPGLKWQDYDAAQRLRPQQLVPHPDKGTSLFFILTNKGIEVRDPQFYVLHEYDLPKSYLSLDSAPSTLKGKSVQAPKASGSALQMAVPSNFKDPSKKIKEEIYYEATFNNLNAIGKLPGSIVMSDFVKFGEQFLMATTDGTDITIFNITQDITPITTGKAPYPGQILALKWWHPSETGPLYLSALHWSDNEALSTIFVLSEEKLLPVQKRIPRILGTFDMDGDNRPETLLGQEFDKENFFGRRTKKLNLNNGKIRYSKSPIELPKRFTVLGSHLADLTRDRQLETIFIRSGILYIYSGKKLVYTSPKQMGGSLSFLTYDVDPFAKNVMITTAAFEVSPITTDLDGDGQAELLTVASEKSYFSSVGITTEVKKSWLAALKYHNGMFHLGTLGQDMRSPVQGLAATDKQVLFVSSETGSISGEGGISYLFAYPSAR
jgi:hypothetical protein